MFAHHAQPHHLIRQLSLAGALLTLLAGGLFTAFTPQAVYAQEQGQQPNAMGGALNPAQAQATQATDKNIAQYLQQIGRNDVSMWVFSTLVTFGGFVAATCGWLLDASISWLVIGMGATLTQSVGVEVNEIWIIIRDVFNLAFIFGLIYIGFKIILNAGDSSARKMLISLIAAAILINFSLLITKGVVDFTNLAAYQIYENLFPEDKTQTISTSLGNAEIVSVGTHFAKLMQIQSIYLAEQDVNLAASTVDDVYRGGLVIVYGIVMMLVLLVAAFVFAAGAFLMLSRFVGLIIFMIFSPVMFIGMIFPGFGNYSKQWWSKFLNYAFVAPAYLFMLFLALRMTSAVTDQRSSFGEAYAAAAGSQGGAAGSAMIIFFNFAIIIAFLVGALLVAQRMGVAGASRSVNLGQKIAHGAGRRVRAGAGFMAQQGVGRLGMGLSKGFDQLESHTGKLPLSRHIKGTFDGIANAKLGYSTGMKDRIERDETYARTRQQEIDQGRAKDKVSDAIDNYQKHNAEYQRLLRAGKTESDPKVIKARNARDEARAVINNASPSQIAKMAESQTTREKLQSVSGLFTTSQHDAFMKSDYVNDSTRESLQEQRATQSDIGRVITAGREAEKVPEASRTQEQKDAIKERDRQAVNVSAKDAEWLMESQAGRDNLLSAADRVPVATAKAVLESQSANPLFKQEFEKKRREGSVKRLNLSTDPTGIKDATKEDLRILGRDTLSDPKYLPYLQDSQLDDMKTLVTDGELSQEEFDKLKNQRKTLLSNGSISMANILKSRKNRSEIAKLPTQTIQHTNFFPTLLTGGVGHQLNEELLGKIVSENDGVDMKQLGANLKSALRAAKVYDDSDDNRWNKFFNDTELGRKLNY